MIVCLTRGFLSLARCCLPATRNESLCDECSPIRTSDTPKVANAATLDLDFHKLLVS